MLWLAVISLSANDRLIPIAVVLTLLGVFPGRTDLNILRTLNPTQSLLNGVSSLGGNNSVLAQLFYDGTETFNCQANSCTQTITSGTGAVDWQCSNLQCVCLPGSTFCGASVSTKRGVVPLACC